MIFIVDDDGPTRDSLRLLLETAGFEAHDFASGKEFLDIARPAKGDCLILDLTMPGMNGFGVLSELRRRGDNLPVIIVTAHADPTTRSRAAAGGALGVIEKPHRADEILSLLRRALGIAGQSGCP